MSLKSKFLEWFIMGKFPNWIYKLAGKKIADKLGLQEEVMGEETTEKPWYKSKAKIAAIVTVIIGAVQPISAAFGHPIQVPDFIIQLLIGLGIYGVRDAIK